MKFFWNETRYRPCNVLHRNLAFIKASLDLRKVCTRILKLVDYYPVEKGYFDPYLFSVVDVDHILTETGK